MCRARRRGPRTPSTTTDANLACAFVKNSLLFALPKIESVRPPLLHPPDRNHEHSQFLGGGGEVNFDRPGGGGGGSEDDEADIRGLCEDGGRFDTIVGTSEDEYFVFKGDKYYKVID